MDDNYWNLTDKMKHNRDLELEFHSCDVLSHFRVHQFLDVGVQTAGSHLCVATDDSFKQRVMDEYILVLSLPK
jgi:hypothetical protein